MKIVLIAALANNRVIGINNTLPWKLSADLKRFKSLTTGHTILMGRKTFESLGRPLPGRKHICISRAHPASRLTADERWPEQVFWCGDLWSAIELLKKNSAVENESLYVIGGAEIYAQSLAIADVLELTHIDANFDGDAFFPCFENLFTLAEQTAGEESELRFRFSRYTSNRPEGCLVRTATAKDIEFIAQSQISMAMESEGMQLVPDVVRRGVAAVLQDPQKGEYLVAEKINGTSESVPVGCLLLQREWSDWRNGNFEWIHSVYIEQLQRRHGLFRWMYVFAAARARTRGALGLRLYVDKKNTVARATYSTLGMTDQHYDLFEKIFD
jgi:dihydrofolate reductase/GNAT superfamily N-acetyltransferase